MSLHLRDVNWEGAHGHGIAAGVQRGVVSFFVMAGLVPAIHVWPQAQVSFWGFGLAVDAPDKPGHDGEEGWTRLTPG